MTTRLGFGLAACVLAASCAVDMMSDHLGQYDQRLGYARVEVSSHSTAVAGASPAEVAALEEGHLTRTLGHMSNMRGDVAQMMECGLTGGAAMSAALDAVGQECRAHRSAMAAATEGTALRAEEDRHRQAMDGMLGGMRVHSQSIMSASVGMRCRH